ncbi:RE1-silencing transcription factor-like isoform X1 [Triticum urartu]|uniref:Uncharacterized protein n=1 Tax=Triticum urartu TaxID=4572 RepID=A0A8R7PSU5_TRIUA|nr:RE1-silencing transcription factor-like isoform X1 [Triticum urartu]
MPPPPPPQPPPPPPPPPPSSPPPLSAHRLPLPPAPSSPTSLLLAPAPSPSRAFALLFPDASARLFASPPPPASAASPAPAPTPVPSPLAAAACFALLLPSSHLLFLSAHPAPSSPAVHLRAYSLASARFAPAPLSFKRHVSPSGLPLHGLPFGLGVRLAGGVNAVALLSLAAGQIWVLAPRMAADGRTLELHKCAVIQLEPTRPVYAMEVAMGRLLLGEAGGVRVFPLRSLMKGGREKEGRKEGAAASAKKSLHKKNGILNGLIVPVGRGSGARGGQGGAASDCKLTTLRVKQNSGSYSSFFLAFNQEDHNSQGGVKLIKLVKAVSIQPSSKDKFLVLDSAGVIHAFSLRNAELEPEAAKTCFLDCAMKVQLFAVFPSSSTKTQILWVSDGGHSIQILSPLPAFDVKSPKSDDDVSDEERELATIKLSATEAIFTSEKVQDIVHISKDSVLILGQGNMFLYGTA